MKIVSSVKTVALVLLSFAIGVSLGMPRFDVPRFVDDGPGWAESPANSSPSDSGHGGDGGGHHGGAVASGSGASSGTAPVRPRTPQKVISCRQEPAYEEVAETYLQRSPPPVIDTFSIRDLAGLGLPEGGWGIYDPDPEWTRRLCESLPPADSEAIHQLIAEYISLIDASAVAGCVNKLAAALAGVTCQSPCPCPGGTLLPVTTTRSGASCSITRSAALTLHPDYGTLVSNTNGKVFCPVFEVNSRAVAKGAGTVQCTRCLGS